MEITARCLREARADECGEVLLRFARDYFSDAQYYAEKDAETALEAVSYAHGLLDAGVLLGHIRIPGYHLKPIKMGCE